MSVHAASGPANSRVRRTVADLQSILAAAERNRKIYEEMVRALDGPELVDARATDVDLSRSLRGSRQPSLNVEGAPRYRSETKRGGRRCYWNVVSCY
ncbi:hypothetical protein RRG08_028718 [Elysia crispata]|uniref:Uncharacterized protein n=1 Tax=Elysia crispata TaxID=231223 RepID=A0AAE1CL38_9GAST|nr:hypothetical protein RRG08_028718 [Elysia crispata]